MRDDSFKPSGPWTPVEIALLIVLLFLCAINGYRMFVA